MPRLIDADRSASRQSQLSEQAPAAVENGRARNSLHFHLLREFIDIIAQQVQLVRRVSFSGVDGKFGRGQGKDQPAVANIYMRELERIPEKLSILLWV